MDSVGGEIMSMSPFYKPGMRLREYIFQLALDTDERPSSSEERP
jgi:hypothetical protein